MSFIYIPGGLCHVVKMLFYRKEPQSPNTTDLKEQKKREKQRLEKEKKEQKEREKKENEMKKKYKVSQFLFSCIQKKLIELLQSKIFASSLEHFGNICLFQVTGEEEPMYHAKVIVASKVRKNDLPVKTGDMVSIIRTTSCPKGKWLARDANYKCE